MVRFGSDLQNETFHVGIDHYDYVVAHLELPECVIFGGQSTRHNMLIDSLADYSYN